jgi:hypothetical protein
MSAGRGRSGRRTSEADAAEEVPDLDLGELDRRRRRGRWSDSLYDWGTDRGRVTNGEALG